MLRTSRNRSRNVTRSNKGTRPAGSPHPAIARIQSLIDGKRWQQAWAELKPWLGREPNNATLHWVAGLLQSELGAPDKAAVHLRFAAQHIQDDASLFERLGAVERALGDTAASERALQQARSLTNGVPALLLLSQSFHESGERSREIEVLEQAHGIDPTDPRLTLRLAHLYQESFDPTPALKWAMATVRLKEDFWEAYLLLGTVLQRLDRLPEALEVYKSLLFVWPKDGRVNRNLGMLCLRLGLNSEAVRYFKRAAEVEPNRIELECDIVHQLLHAADWPELEPQIQSLLQAFRSSAQSLSPFAFLSVPSASALDLRTAAERAATSILGGLRKPALSLVRPVRSMDPDRPLRIGYLSSDLYEHATGYLMARLFELHDRSQFRLFAYTWDEHHDDPLRRRIAPCFDSIKDIRGLADQQAAELVRADEIDVLVDLKGYTRDGRMPILAYRPAPVQVHHVGFPGTLGAPFIDYLVADRIVAPPDRARYYSEKLAYLPDCYQPTDEMRPIGRQPSRRECDLPERGVVFSSFNQAYKITPDVFGLWCRLLQEVPDSVLWLLHCSKTATANLRRAAEARGVASERLVFAAARPQTEHLGRLQNADIVLDTLPVNAHTTASDALWAGVPIVTRPGEPFVSRVAASIISAAGLPELVARDDEDYVRIAKELAQNPEHLASVKERVRAGRTSALFDSARYTRNLEALYRVMWKRHAAGLAPVAIDIDGEAG
jgi:predicted O-linked N-acetylglucosamine transferase (SPINDLY family)